MAIYVPPKINTIYIFYISLVSQANTKIFQVNPTLAAADFNVATDDGAPAALGTTPVIDADFTRRVKVTLSAAEMNGGNVTFIASDNAGAEWCDLTINIQTSARQIDDLAFPVTSGRGLDVTATGAAGVDWANVENPTTALALTGTTIAVTQKVDVDTIKTNPVVNAGTITFPTTATLASTTNITAGTIATVTNLTNAPTAGDLTATMKTSVTTAVPTAAVNAAAVWDLDATTHQTQGTFGQAIGDPVADANTIYGAVVTGAAGATVAADIIAVKADTAAILLDTAEIGVAGAGLTNIGTIATVTNLTNLPATAALEATLTAMKGATFTGATDSLEAIRDRGDAAWITATGFATPTNITAGTITTVTNLTTNNDKTGYALSAAGVQAIWDALTSALTTVGSIGKKLADWVIGTTQTADVAAVKTQTDKLTFTVANQVDANIQSVNDVTVTGNGQTGTEWNP
mgnify:CR=1 FL=1